MSLATCPECNRHVNVSETDCPFCKAILPSDMSARVQNRPANRNRFGRAALVSFSAVVATSAVACAADDDDTGNDQNAQSQGGSGGTDAGAVGGSSSAGASTGGQLGQPVYGVPIDPPDANIGQPEYGVPIDYDASVPEGEGGTSTQPVYGLPVDSSEDG